MTTRWHHSIAEIPETAWNTLAQHLPTGVMSHQWLRYLEDSGTVSPSRGWTARHLSLWDGDTLIGAMPLYLRDESWGEFVFDFAFADAAAQLSLPYYPKLVGMSPVTPSTAYAPLVAPQHQAEELIAVMMAAIAELCDQEGIGTVQFNYLLPSFRALFERYGFTAWEHQSYRWEGAGYATFADYLAHFRKGQRRNIRRERASMADQGLVTRIIPGIEAADIVLQRMEEFYRRTNRQFGPWGAEFLAEDFFLHLPEPVRRQIIFSAAFSQEDPEDPLALAMLVTGRTTLLGRYWGTRVDAANLHFELCYYLPMEWAISQGITYFDPGMGSEHKIRRGFLSVPAVSMHRSLDPTMDAIFRYNLPRANHGERERIQLMNEAVPFRARRSLDPS